MTRDRFLKLLRDYEDQYGVRGMLLVKKSSGGTGPLRAGFYSILRDEGLTYSDIGRLCGRHHTTIIKQLGHTWPKEIR